MIANIKKSIANGIVTAPPSKSMAHRHMICAALSKGKSTIENIDYSQDILATLDCIEALGANVCRSGSTVIIDGIDFNNVPGNVSFMCRESGSTMRFFMGIAMCLGIKSSFYGSVTLRNRPFVVYEDICRDNNLSFLRDTDCIHISGKLPGGELNIPGNVSSQFITGLMFALPLLESDSVINIIPPFESKSYIDLTLQSMQDFGININWSDENTIIIKGKQNYSAADICVEGDYSNAAFLEAFNMIGGSVTVEGLRPDSLQGDKAYIEAYSKLKKGNDIIDISNCPDLGPVLFSVAAANHGGVFTGTRRLKMKESDRGRVMCRELSRFGVDTEMEDNRIVIGTMNKELTDIATKGHNDHRIVMSMAILLTITGGTIEEAEAVRKSYPGFFEDIKELGIEVENNGMD